MQLICPPDSSSQCCVETTQYLNDEDGETELALIQQQLTVYTYFISFAAVFADQI